MAKSANSSVVADARDFTEADWLRYGTNPNPAIREKMILLAIEEMQNVGPLDFRTHVICSRLGIKAPNVNHFFGSRDGFLAETVFYAQTDWVNHLRENILKAPKDPKKRLRAWIDGEIAWGQKAKAMGIFANYPILSADAQKILTEKYGKQFQRNFEYALAVVTTLVIDYRSGKFSSLEFTVDNYPRVELMLKHSPEFLVATSMSWAVHGIASWSSGEHIATTNLEDPKLSKITAKFTVEQYIKRIMKMAEA